jgi:hypothetical protein
LGTIIFWVLVCGAAGGSRNIFVDLQQEKDFRWYLIPRRLLEGVIAAATVPLFLSLIGNDIVGTIVADNPVSTVAVLTSATLKFAGFCLVAALYSKTYLDSLSAKVMQLQKDVAESKKEAGEAKKEAEIVSQTLNAAVVESEPKPVHSGATEALTEQQIQVLKAFISGPYLIRSVEGIMLSAHLSESEVLSSLSSLQLLGLVRVVVTGQGRRWTTTPEGRALAASLT